MNKINKLFFTLLLLGCSNLFAQEPLFVYPKLVVGANPTDNLPTSGDYSLFVTKGILSEKVRVAQKGGTSWADYVFNTNYKLKPLSQVKEFIEKNGHLPDVPSAKTVAKEGIDLADTQRILLQKIEELTLYILEQDKKIKELDQKVTTLQHK